MKLEPSARLGPYEILQPIGAGGMGEVYEAKDTRLDRRVAIKVLPEHLAKDPERRERFEREARAVSSLNHPHICTLHDIGEHDGVHYLVMEHIEGDTLADRLKRGALPLNQALDYGSQIADALDKAHRAGIVHRDLKPGNIMLNKAGVKLLDFGLAKTREEPLAPTGDSEQPTQNKPLTDAGTILGTVQYMAPEQLEGKEVDARADLFSLGAVLYEMLTGRKAFAGESQASLITAIMSTEPPLVSELQTMSPPVLDRVVRTCIAKDPDLRWQSATDIIRALELVPKTGDALAATATRPSWKPAWLAPALLAVAIGAVVLASLRDPPSSSTGVTRFVIRVPENEELYGNAVGRHLAVSPDGRHVVYGTQSGSSSRLYIRALESYESRTVPGSENGETPFFSPDGRFLTFLKKESGSIVSVALDGGSPPRTICEGCAHIRAGATAPYGGTWTRGGDIIYGATVESAGLMITGAEGGAPRALTLPDEGTSHGAPQALPDGKTLLFTVTDATGKNHPALLDLASEEWHVLPAIESVDIFRYVSSRHLVWIGSTDSLMAAPFSFRERDIVGTARPVVDRLFSGFGKPFSVSDGGTLAYLPSTLANVRLMRVDREGRATPATADARNFDHPRLSPDGSRLAADVQEESQWSVWVYDLVNGARTRLTFDEEFYFPCWHMDGQTVFFAGASSTGLYSKRADGSGAIEPFPVLPELARSRIRATSHHRRGHALMVGASQTNWDIWFLPTGEEPVELLATPFNETGGVISPDGRYLAYSSNESGRFEVYVLELGGSRRYTVSTGGGSEPTWSADGTELFFRHGLETGTTQLLAVPVRTVPAFEAGEPSLLFEGPYGMSGIGEQHYAASPDGQSFIMVESRGAGGEVHVVVNWFDELKRLVPAE